MDHDGHLPASVAIKKAREHEVKQARTLKLPKGPGGLVELAGIEELGRRRGFKDFNENGIAKKMGQIRGLALF